MTNEILTARFGATIDCPACQGTGTYRIVGTTYAAPCSGCAASGSQTAPDETCIRAAIFTAKRGAYRLRASFPRHRGDARSYYVWRLARFHGGADVTLPVMADLGVRHDAFKADLDRMADDVAREAFGDNMRAARRWGQALGFAR